MPNVKNLSVNNSSAKTKPGVEKLVTEDDNKTRKQPVLSNSPINIIDFINNEKKLRPPNDLNAADQTAELVKFGVHQLLFIEIDRHCVNGEIYF